VNPSFFRWRERARRLQARSLRLFHDEVIRLEPAKLCAELTTAAMPHLAFNYLRTLVWRAAGMRVGARARIMGPLHITGAGPWQEYLTVGKDTVLTGPIRIDVGAPVHIGDRVRIGHDVMLLTVDHEIGETEQRCAASIARPIRVGEGAWLASRCVILPGVSIGNGAVVAAGAVVTHDVPADTLVGGVPARVLRSLNEAAPNSGIRDAQAKAETSRSPDLRALS
jgi:acetyltransferase-like isoleucine patch superfamily enzyme